MVLLSSIFDVIQQSGKLVWSNEIVNTHRSLSLDTANHV